jgi:diguanylate cyclase (GGDEF)-like protein
MTTLAAAGTFVFTHGAATLVGFFTVAFFYIGMTQRRWTSLAILPVALPCWAAAYGGITRDLWLRMPISIGIWVLVAESLAASQQRTRELAQGLAVEASTDPLTGLDNRRDLAAKLDALAVGDAIVLLDIDNFKALNDQFGHAAGDKVLSDLGAIIRDVVRPGDTTIRFGGEELLLALPQAGNGGAVRVLRRLQARWIPQQPGITFSAGIAVVSETLRPAEILASADRALYRAKRDGRNCWRFAADNAPVSLP